MNFLDKTAFYIYIKFLKYDLLQIYDIINDIQIK